MPVKIFFCYSHEDEPLLKKLQTHLRPLQYEGLIDIWHDRDISAGTSWDQEIKDQLNNAQIILLLVSPDFMASDYCYSVEMKLALERHERGEARVIPIILRHSYWRGTLGTLQVLPKDGIPIIDSDWHNIDRALFNVVEGILKVVDEIKFSLASTLETPLQALNTGKTELPESDSIPQPSIQKPRGDAEDLSSSGIYGRMRPLIGIPILAHYSEGSKRPIFTDTITYIHSVESAGGVPVLIPFMEDFSMVDTLLARIDGLLLCGGVDVEPSRYGEYRHKLTEEPDKMLDEFELTIVVWAMREDIPILGIGRGMQVMNVALGGTLYQDIRELCPDTLPHARHEHPRDFLAHTVEVEPGSRMEEVLGTRSIMVNSLHHQAVHEPGQGVVISGRAQDGIAELMEVPAYRFMLAVQFHPEEIYKKETSADRLFKAFIRASRIIV